MSDTRLTLNGHPLNVHDYVAPCRPPLAATILRRERDAVAHRRADAARLAEQNASTADPD